MCFPVICSGQRTWGSREWNFACFPEELNKFHMVSRNWIPSAMETDFLLDECIEWEALTCTVFPCWGDGFLLRKDHSWSPSAQSLSTWNTSFPITSLLMILVTALKWKSHRKSHTSMAYWMPLICSNTELLADNWEEQAMRWGRVHTQWR